MKQKAIGIVGTGWKKNVSRIRLCRSEIFAYPKKAVCVDVWNLFGKIREEPIMHIEEDAFLQEVREYLSTFTNFEIVEKQGESK